MSFLKKPIDYQMLEAEFEKAIEADELYKLQNDAKIRAIEQRVPTYNDFHNMVQAAHLRPLEQHELKKKAELTWNHCFNKNEELILEAYNNLNQLLSKSNKKYSIYEKHRKPQTSTEFLKIWKNLSDFKSKFEYLLKFRHCLKDKFFKVEVTSEFIQEFCKLGLEICSEDTVSQIIEILQICSECNRFSLSLAMISVQEKNSIRLLFDKMIVCVKNDIESDSVKKLIKVYCISLEENTKNNGNTN